MKAPADLLYTRDHEWLKVEGETALVGITDYAQLSLGDIVFVELPEVDHVFKADDEFAVVESVKAASDIYLPIAGTVIEVNDTLIDAPALINQRCYNAWMVKIKISDLDELKDLLDSESYLRYCTEQI